MFDREYDEEEIKGLFIEDGKEEGREEGKGKLTMSTEQAENFMTEMEKSLEEAFDIAKCSDIITLMSSLLFGLIVYIVYFPVFIIADGILDTKLNGIPFIIDCILSNFVIILGGMVSVGIYNRIVDIIKRIKKTSNLFLHFELQTEKRMWVFLLVFLGYSFIGIEDSEIQGITSLAVSLIIGRFFWVDNELDNVKKIIASYKSLPRLIKCTYSIIILLCVFSYFDIPKRIFIAFELVIVIAHFILFIREAFQSWGIHMTNYMKDNNIEIDSDQ